MRCKSGEGTVAGPNYDACILYSQVHNVLSVVHTHPWIAIATMITKNMFWYHVARTLLKHAPYRL
jgi:hypothetical protein